MKERLSGYVRDVEQSAIHRAARTEDAVRAVVNAGLLRRGWSPQVVPYTGYGTPDWVRLLGRVLVTPPGARVLDPGMRGWRRFVSAPADGVAVRVELAGRRYDVESGRDGYLDLVLPAQLPVGRTEATLTIADGPAVRAPLHVVDPSSGRGIVSDIDDTVMVTALPRPVVAFWNTFVRREASRRPVPGMASLYRALLQEHPDSLVVYLSTGPWNVAPALDRFLATHGYPPGPLLLTDWGPTPDGWFRSGREHKRTQLGRLLGELPGLTWTLVGDDGQHDPEVYAGAAQEFPGRVEAIVIRQLSALEQVLTHGTADPPDEPAEQRDGPVAPVEVRAQDGDALAAELRMQGLLGRHPAQ